MIALVLKVAKVGAEPAMKRPARGRGPLDEAHHTKQHGTQKSPEAEIHYVCRRHDAAALVCVRTAAPVDRRAGSCWARARPEPERSRGSWWTSLC